MTQKSYFFGEWVEYQNDEEKIEALEYLNLWVKFFQRKIPDMKMVNSPQIIDRPKVEFTYAGAVRMCKRSTLGVKIEMLGEKPENLLSLDDLPIN